MENYLSDPWRASAVADGAVQRAAQELHDVLVALATSLDPFPGFQGLQTLRAVEVDLENLAKPGRGCVVVGPDGILYELVLRTIPGPIEVGGMDQLDELEELHLDSHEYVVYAYQAIHQLAEMHHRRQQ